MLACGLSPSFGSLWRRTIHVRSVVDVRCTTAALEIPQIFDSDVLCLLALVARKLPDCAISALLDTRSREVDHFA